MTWWLGWLPEKNYNYSAKYFSLSGSLCLDVSLSLSLFSRTHIISLKISLCSIPDVDHNSWGKIDLARIQKHCLLTIETYLNLFSTLSMWACILKILRKLESPVLEKYHYTEVYCNNFYCNNHFIYNIIHYIKYIISVRGKS